jgi:pimeloyl-ACP methyl ester carboxylesterase
MSYQARRAPHTETLVLRGLKFQLYRWPGTDPQPLVLVHGWGDTSETWQFVVDHLSPARTVVAMDMRGFGRTQRPEDGYWFADYLADLDALLDHLSADAPLDLVGHSMGGNIVMLYAGVRPQRVRKVASLEAFGLPRTNAEQAPARYAEWLDEVKTPATFATYDNYDQFMRVLSRRNPRTPPDRLEFVARSWARSGADGRIELWADPKHKHVNPVLYQRADEAHGRRARRRAPAQSVRESDDGDVPWRRPHDPSRAPGRNRRLARALLRQIAQCTPVFIVGEEVGCETSP